MNIYSSLSSQNIITSNQVTGTEDKTAADIAKEQAEKEKVDFLKLLLTQLSNQNPLDPMDTDEWTAQLTRYSILEQGIETNQQLTIANDALAANMKAASLSYIGKKVELDTNIGVVQNGAAEWSYLVEGSPSEVYLTLTDKNGTKIAEVEGSINSGVQSVGLDAADFGLAEGQQVYLSINAKDSEGNKLNTKTTTNVKVDGAWSDENDTYLTAGEASFRMSDILKIANDVSNNVVINDSTNEDSDPPSNEEADAAGNENS